MRLGCVVVVGLVVAGCGGSAKTVTHTTARTASTPTPATTTNASSKDCDSLGINPTGMREGTCTHAGITYVIVDENHTLLLHTLSAHLSGVSVVSALSGTEPSAAQKFVIATISIRNGLSLPQSLDRSGTVQAGLILDGTVIQEDTSVERSSDPSSCLTEHPLAAGKSETCQVVFQVPSASSADLGKHGRADLYLVDFGSDLAGNPPPQTVGQIRLYR